jgi:macrolide transport system ATP-binding/permease protein
LRWYYKLPLRLRSLFRKDRVELDLSDELQFHLQNQVEEYVAQGMDAQEARYAALRLLGDVEQVKEECREARKMDLIENFVRDVRLGLRMLRHNPGFTVLAILWVPDPADEDLLD